MIYAIIPDKHYCIRSFSLAKVSRLPIRRNSPLCIWRTLLIAVDQTSQATRRASVRAAYLPNYARSSHGPWTRMQITRTSSCQHELSTIHRALNCSCCRRYCSAAAATAAGTRSMREEAINQAQATSKISWSHEGRLSHRSPTHRRKLSVLYIDYLSVTEKSDVKRMLID